MTTDPVRPLDERATVPAGKPAADGHDELPQYLLLDSVAQFTHHRDIDALDHSLTLTLAELAGARRVSLYKRASEHSGPESLVRCDYGQDGGHAIAAVEPDEEDPLLQLLRQGVGQLTTRATRGPDGDYRLLVPIHRDGAAIGALLLESAHPLDALLLVVDGFARIYANYIGLINESERDKLTGLYNRRTFERQLQRQLGRAARGLIGPRCLPPAPEARLARRGTLWLALLDIDHFKRINDTYGHLYGDEVILLIAQKMRACFRQDDVLFRFGGEEFVVLLLAADEAAAHAALERFRTRVASYVFPQIGCVTVSIGYVGVEPQDYPATVLDRADKALYYAKNSGRNRVCHYRRLIAEGVLGDSVAAGSVDLF
ncbi:GGDEF domain-containing protein [Frateuria defendens]|uniref:GGDEF domain-containing protein n=1 Tax=Frateuria defendens TaxID=2219559 RepID=UPI001F450F19|nr:GGDEF domain-containing protein [Frateuria defendens]